MVLRRANPLLGALEGVGPVNLDFFWPRYGCCNFRSQKGLDFHGPTPLTMVLVMGIARLKIITSRAIKTTGTLIVLNIWWPYATLLAFFKFFLNN
jgi:hypothetical protein